MDFSSLSLPAFKVLLQDAAKRDLTTARRAALLQILLDERYLTRSQLMARVEGLLGAGCFGAAAWEDAFYRDMRVVKNALASAGFQARYSRSAALQGYYLTGQPTVSSRLGELLAHSAAEVDPAQMRIFRQMAPAERFRLGSSASDTALQAVAYRIRQQNPNLSQAEAGLQALQQSRGEDRQHTGLTPAQNRRPSPAPAVLGRCRPVGRPARTGRRGRQQGRRP